MTVGALFRGPRQFIAWVLSWKGCIHLPVGPRMLPLNARHPCLYLSEYKSLGAQRRGNELPHYPTSGEVMLATNGPLLWREWTSCEEGL